MDTCRALAEQGAPEGVVVIADQQTAGRGRAGRAWYSPPGVALYLSILLRPVQLPPARLSWLTVIGGLAVADCAAQVLREHAAFDAHRIALKWPNDVLLDGRKVAGVLIEAAWHASELVHVVLGVGLNVNTQFDSAPAALRTQAISLREALGAPLDRERVLTHLLDAFAAHYARLPQSPIAAYRQRLDTLGKSVQFMLGERSITGVALDVDEEGALLVQTAAGLQRITHGDVLA